MSGRPRRLRRMKEVSRCAHLTSADLDELEKGKDKANAARQTTRALHCFRIWLNLKNIEVNFQFVETQLNAFRHSGKCARYKAASLQ